MSDTLNTMLERAVDLAQRTVISDHRQRIAAAAHDLSLAGQMQAHLDTVTASMVALINMLYEADTDGGVANYDERTGRILVRGLPWGDTGWRKWGLRKWEAVCLRRLLIERSKARRRLPALFDYNEFSRQWHINHQIYPDAAAALSWLKRDGPTLAEWRTIVMDYRHTAHERMLQKRTAER